MSVRKYATPTSKNGKNPLDTIAANVSAMELVCTRLANEAEERSERSESLAQRTLQAVNAMEESVRSMGHALQMLLERAAAPQAAPTNPPRGRTVDDLLKDGVDVLVQRLWNGHVERLVWQSLIITPVEKRNEWSSLVKQHFDIRAAVNGDESDEFCVHEIGCLFNDTMLDERAREFKTALLGSLGKRFGATRRKQKSIWKAAIHSQFKSGDPDTFGGLPEVFGDLQAAQLAVLRLVAFNALPPDGRTWCNSGSMLSDYALRVAHNLAVTPLQTLMRKKSSNVDADADADAYADADDAAVELAPPQQGRSKPAPATLGSAGGKRPSPFSLPKPQCSERSVERSVAVASVTSSSSTTPAKAATPNVISRTSTPSPTETLAATTQRPTVSVTTPFISTTTSKSKGNIEDVMRAHGLSFAKPTLSTADNDTSTTAHRAKKSRTTLIVDDDDDNDCDDKVVLGGSQSREE